MAMATAEPSPAAVITCARGLVALPAAQTPGTVVRPVGVGADEPVLEQLAAERRGGTVARARAARGG